MLEAAGCAERADGLAGLWGGGIFDARDCRDVVEACETVLDGIGLISGTSEGVSESSSDAGVDFDSCEVIAPGSEGGDDVRGWIELAMLTFRDGGQAPAILFDGGGVLAAEFLDGGGFGGGVRGIRSNWSVAVRATEGLSLLRFVVESARETGILAPFRGAGGAGFNFSFSVVPSATIHSSGPPSLHGLPFLSGLSFIPSRGGLI